MLCFTGLVFLCHFFPYTFLPIYHGPGVDSASNRNEYQEYFLGGKGGRCLRLTTLPPSCAVVTYSGSLNFLEPSGPLQACNGTDLPLLLVITVSALSFTFFPLFCLFLSRPLSSFFFPFCVSYILFIWKPR